MDKKNQKISKQQKEKLVEYMSANLEFARGQFGGINSNSNCKEQWEFLRRTLNSLGGSDKSIEQWKKCWIDLKAGVKKQINSRRSFMNKTGGGAWSEVPRDLSHIEEDILKVMTVDAVDGDGCTPESGVFLNESMYSIEVLDDEEICPPPEKKQKITPLAKRSMTTESKYKEAIEESKRMHEEMISKMHKIEKKLEKIENQNDLILEKFNNFLGGN